MHGRPPPLFIFPFFISSLFGILSPQVLDFFPSWLQIRIENSNIFKQLKETIFEFCNNLGYHHGYPLPWDLCSMWVGPHGGSSSVFLLFDFPLNFFLLVGPDIWIFIHIIWIKFNLNNFYQSEWCYAWGPIMQKLIISPRHAFLWKSLLVWCKFNHESPIAWFCENLLLIQCILF